MHVQHATMRLTNATPMDPRLQEMRAHSVARLSLLIANNK